MACCKLVVNMGMLRPVLSALTQAEQVQFIDENEETPLFSRQFAKDLVRISDIQGKLQFVRSQIENGTGDIHHRMTDDKLNSVTESETFLDKVITEYKALASELTMHESSYAQVFKKFLALKNAGKVSCVPTPREEREDSAYTEQPDDNTLQSFFFLIPRRLTFILTRTMYRVTYSNIMYDTFALDEEIDGTPMDLMSIYVTGSCAADRCRKVINSYNLEIYEIPTDMNSELKSTEQTLSNFLTTVELCKARMQNVLFQCSAYIDQLHEFLETEKVVVNAMNMFQLTDNVAQCRCWVQEEQISAVEDLLELTDKNHHSGIKTILQANIITTLQPPTFFPRNKFTAVFQNIVNSYGIPSYREINPAFFYLFQFPFTYSLMFGDVGHGVINAICGLLMILFEKKLALIRNDMFELIFMGRYVIFLMSCYSIITGFIYNDFFALGFNIASTKYAWTDPVPGSGKFIGCFKGDCSIPAGAKAAKSPISNFGIDPFWHWGDNSMIFLNSYKMKLSVVIGISQMIFGLLIKLINLIQHKETKKLITVWIPEFFFMASFFGYMVFCIIYKWLNVWPTGSNPPSLINLLIQIFLSPGKIDPAGQLFNDINLQSAVQLAIFFVAVVCVFWLMLAEPIVEIIEIKKHGNKDKAISDIIVQQVIHTIEFVLGCISHTASYLRLWALSLAHSQLAEVFFDQMLGITIGLKFDSKTTEIIVGGFSLFITYGGWLGASIAVLCLMEALSAFLHCLRLSWIEFNSKFFAAEGYQFEPLRTELGFSLDISSEIARNV